MRTWQQYQLDVAALFTDLGLQAQTDVRRHGARGQHDIDVLVSFRTGGVEALWVVECKQWKRAVPKERVLVLQQVVADLGADRGLLLSESGFQAGAIRAAAHTNITLTSVADLRENAESERRQAAVQRHLSRCADLAGRVRRLWLWTTPQTVKPALPLEAMIETAGYSFELQNFVVPRLIAGELPLTVHLGQSPRTATSADEVDAVVGAACAQVQAAVEELERAAATASTDAQTALAELTQHLCALLAVGRDLGSPTALSADDGARFVAEMRAVDAAATHLTEHAPEQVARAVRAVMRHLIDSTYLLPERPERDWDQEQVRLNELLAATEQVIGSVAVADPGLAPPRR